MRLAMHALAVLVLASLAFLVRETRLTAFTWHLESQRYEDIYYLPPANWLPVLSLGFRDAAADLIWCQSMVYFGEELILRGAVKHVFEYTDAVIALDPDFKQAYRWIGIAAVSRPTGISMADGLRAAKYVERALERWPNDGELHWEYGSLLRFDLAPLLERGPEKDRLLELAAPHLATAASLGAGPPWLALNSASLLERLGRTEQAIRHLEEVYGTVQSEFAKREIEERLAALRTHAFVEALKTATEQFERERTASFAYLTPGLFMLVGPKLDADWPALAQRRFLPAEEPAQQDLEGAEEAAQ
jgi:tetratricopeptide (TPR) repeat protein